MTKKGWTKIMIIVVACLWGYNIYRTIENYQLKEERQEIAQQANSIFAPVLFNKDTFDLILPNSDPFLRQNSWKSNNVQSAPNPSRSSVAVTQPSPAPIVQKKWPKISYFGFLKNHNANHQLCMLSIDGKNYRYAVGEAREGFKIIEAFPDSIRILFSDEMKTILK